MKNGHNYRILSFDGRIQFTGSNIGSWFTLEQARELVNCNEGEAIYEYDANGDRLWEIC